MSQDKKFKQHIRERMERTGEPYMAAKRHLSSGGDDGAPPQSSAIPPGHNVVPMPGGESLLAPVTAEGEVHDLLRRVPGFPALLDRRIAPGTSENDQIECQMEMNYFFLCFKTLVENRELPREAWDRIMAMLDSVRTHPALPEGLREQLAIRASKQPSA